MSSSVIQSLAGRVAPGAPPMAGGGVLHGAGGGDDGVINTWL